MPTQIDSALIDKLAHLAGLDFSEVEKDGLKKDLAQILVFINQIKTVDTTNVEPMSHCVVKQQRLRQDVVTEIVDDEQQTKLQRLASHAVIDGLYCVPKVKE